MTSPTPTAIQQKISKSEEEIRSVLHWLKDPKFDDPENLEGLAKPGRENFFEGFFEEVKMYRVVDKWDKHELKCYMLIPRTLKLEKKVLIHVSFHGGGLTTGGGNYIHWFSDYKRDLAIDANAIALIPMHRLMPEDRGADIYQDVDQWWSFYKGRDCKAWVEECLQKHKLSNDCSKVDWNGLLITGESAGGLLAVYTWLTQPANLPIQAMYLQYPMLNYYEREIPKDRKVEYMGLKISAEEVFERADKLMDVVSAQETEGRVVSRSDSKPPICMAAASLLSHTKKWERVFKGRDDTPDAPTLLKRKLDLKQPPSTRPDIFIIHGAADTAVPVANTRAFVDMLVLQKDLPEYKDGAKIHFREMQGEGHAFDYEVKKGGNTEREKIIGDLMVSLIKVWTA